MIPLKVIFVSTALSCLLFVSSSCEKIRIDREIRKAYQENLDKWNSHNIESYQVTFEYSCKCYLDICERPSRVEVIDGEIYRILYPETDSTMYCGALALDSAAIYQEWSMIDAWTIEDYFRKIENSEGLLNREFRYDAEYGFPTYITYEFENTTFAVETYSIYDFEII